jgi:hypothetical protein
LLLPAFPVILVFSSAVIFDLAAWLPQPRTARLAALVLVGSFALHGIVFVHGQSVLESAGERRYETVGRHSEEDRARDHHRAMP